jgi:glycosyltransferase involved in cell wall biosynthesis
MVRALGDRPGLDVEVATTDADGPNERLTQSSLPDGIGPVHLFRRDGSEKRKVSRDLNRWLRREARQYDLIQIHSLWNAPVAAACSAARAARVPYVIRPCGMLSAYTWQRSKWKKRLYWWLRESENVHHAAGFHVTSDDERAEVMRLGVTAPVDVIPLGIGDEAWQEPTDPNWLRSQCPQAGRRPILLFLSRLNPKKGIVDLLLPALRRMKNEAFLAIVGGEDERAPGFRTQIEKEIRDLNLCDRVALLGPLSGKKRWRAFDGCDLFILPSHSENFGIVVAEAMARGKPVIVTTGVQFGEHVRASGAGEVVRPEPVEVAATCDRWLSDSSQRARAGEAGRLCIRQNFTWQRTAERMTELYDRICRRESSTPC